MSDAEKTLLEDLLQALRQARIDQAEAYERLQAAQAPWKEQMLRASQVEARKFKAAQELEQELSAMAREEFEAASSERQEALRAGQIVGALGLPEGCTVRSLPRAVIRDEAAIPRECCKVHTPAVLARLQKGPVPGAELVKVPSFVFAAKREAG